MPVYAYINWEVIKFISFFKSRNYFKFEFIECSAIVCTLVCTSYEKNVHLVSTKTDITTIRIKQNLNETPVFSKLILAKSKLIVIRNIANLRIWM